MKFTLNPNPPADRTEAWACLMANLAFPGSGSLAAGKSIGYVQLALALLGLVISLVTGVALVKWAIANIAPASQPPADPGAMLMGLWHVVFWPLVGLAIFVFALIWGLMTSAQVLMALPKNSVPPRIGS